MKESDLRQLIREEIKGVISEAGEAKPVSWDSVNADLKRNRDGIFMSLHRDDYLTVDLGRGTLDIPVDKSRDPYYG